MLLNRRIEINKSLLNTNRNLSAYHFLNLFCWQDYFQFDLKWIDEYLCVFAQNSTGVFMYLPPLAQNVKASTIKKCFEHMNSINGLNGVSRIENVSDHDIKFYDDSFYRKEFKGYDYCYFKRDLIELKGGEYKSKRNAINSLQEQYSYKYSEFDESLIEQCLELFDSWQEKRKSKYVDDLYNYMIDENRSVHRLLMESYADLDLIGRVIFIDGKVSAYTFGYPLNENMFCVLFEITDLNVRGLGATIFHEFAKDEKLNSYKFINAMDDSMLKNLAVSKMSFRPSVLLSSYTIYQN